MRMRVHMRWMAITFIAFGVAVAMPALASAVQSPAHKNASIPDASEIQVRPTSGPAGSRATVRGRGFSGTLCTEVDIWFTDAGGTTTLVGVTSGPQFTVGAGIPANALPGSATITAIPWVYCPPSLCHRPSCRAAFTGPTTGFTVTGGPIRTLPASLLSAFV